MAKHIELGLNRMEQAEVPDQNKVDETREKPNFAEAGAARIARASERVGKVKDAVKSGFFSFIKRVAAVPEMTKYYRAVVNEKSNEALTDIHTKAGEMKDSVVDAVSEKFVAVGEGAIEAGQATAEFVKSDYHKTVERGRNGYKMIEQGTVDAYTTMRTKMHETRVAAKSKWEGWKNTRAEKAKAREFELASQKLNKAMLRFNNAAKAVGKEHLVYQAPEDFAEEPDTIELQRAA
jgi:hypothetical protein